MPQPFIEGEDIIVPFLWIGSSLTPRKPFLSFKALWEEELGMLDTVTVYSLIKSFNIEALVEILEELDKLDRNLATNMIRTSTLNQLKVIGGSFEDY